MLHLTTAHRRKPPPQLNKTSLRTNRTGYPFAQVHSGRLARSTTSTLRQGVRLRKDVTNPIAVISAMKPNGDALEPARIGGRYAYYPSDSTRSSTKNVPFSRLSTVTGYVCAIIVWSRTSSLNSFFPSQSLRHHSRTGSTAECVFTVAGSQGFGACSSSTTVNPSINYIWRRGTSN